MSCPACNGDEVVELGVLGRRLWRRCRACGLDRSIYLALDTEISTPAEREAYTQGVADGLELSHG